MKYVIIIVIVGIVLLLALVVFGITTLGATTRLYRMKNKDGREVHFLGTAHIGNKWYWKKIQKELAVFHETTGAIICEAVPDYMGLSYIMTPFKQMAKYTDTIYQQQGIKYNIEWEMCDVSFYELTQMDDKWQKSIKSLYKSAEFMKDKSVGVNRILFNSGCFYSCNFENDPLVIDRNTRPYYRVENSTDNIMMVFGAAHWPDMKVKLENLGFTVYDMKSFHPFLERKEK